MKLFKPTIHWLNENGVRSVTFGILDNPDYTMMLISTDGGRPELVITPQKYNLTAAEGGEEISDEDFADEMSFLSGLSTIFKMPAVGFLAAKDVASEQVALGAIHVIADNLLRQIEFTPRTAESTIEMVYRSELAGVPPALGAMLFGPDVVAELVTPESDFERELRLKYHNGKDFSSTEEMQAVMDRELPLPSYQYITPTVPAEAVQAYKEVHAAHRLATMPVQGPAQ